MRTELIISTYNSPQTLRMTLKTVLNQSQIPCSVAIADDGSGPETKQMLEAFLQQAPGLALRHVWHADKGFRKTIILNQAIATSDADYLIFTDGDCLLSPDFIARHKNLARPTRYCCGSMLRLSSAATASVSEAEVENGTVFSRGWLDRKGATDTLSHRLKAGAGGAWLGNLLEQISPVRRSFCGANASVFRTALLAVNGFDETMVWGGEDKELGVRLGNSGVKGRHLRYTAPLLHLDHPKGYADPERALQQRGMIHAARRLGTVWTENGITTRHAA